MQRERKGFTIIELLVVVLIITMLVVFVAPRMFKGLSKTKIDIARSKMAILESALGNFYIDCGRYPSDDEGLEALIEAPAEFEEQWNGPYLKYSHLEDPWKNPYIYEEEGTINVGSFDIVSCGSDGEPGGEEGSEDEDIFNE